MEVRLSSHCAYCLQYHVVWVCKYRRRVLKPGVRHYLHKVLLGLQRSMPGVEIETIGFDGDHLHMVMIIPPKYSIADVMGEIEKPIVVQDEKEVQMAIESLLEGKYHVVSGLLCEQCWNR